MTKKPNNKVTIFFVNAFLILIKAYQKFVSPLLGQNCRFYPSCSCYAQESLKTHGLVKGLWLTTKRISKCHPLHQGGFDYVPEPNRMRKHDCAKDKINRQY